MKYTKAVTIGINGLLKKIPGENNWTVKKEFKWYLNYVDKKEFVIVPVGFNTNFGSIPRPLWWAFDKTKYIAYILHDFLYSGYCFIINDESKNIRHPTRKEADLILIEAMELEGASTIEKLLVFIGVRLFGWLFYKKDIMNEK